MLSKRQKQHHRFLREISSTKILPNVIIEPAENFRATQFTNAVTKHFLVKKLGSSKRGVFLKSKEDYTTTNNLRMENKVKYSFLSEKTTSLIT